ncbi:hypothetical protein HG535_0A06260 [Zygotorulaspora mrakii]|uniref:Sulfurtransferase n=1 Tax=Zygotorulaspora mrakii TaxID=42260 RepID=A0A7H9AX78_ZYGMR|nr:uncharacterized protein HG535_0A06260 [Zygotorulaspora mrakii]QLG70684.1 hypothetical protein HG535_0A06260 [Zygotorulaspora mrakii]
MSLYKLLSPKAFVELLQKETVRRVIPVDSTWYLPNLKRDGKKEYLEVERIPNAVYFDIDRIKDTNSPYPHMAPTIEQFNKGMSELGITKDDVLVVYDRIGTFSAPRCAWTLSMFGHNPVFLLNNFNLYKKAGYPLDTAKKTTYSGYETTSYKAHINLCSENVVSYETILDLVQKGNLKKKYNVYDARSLGRFEGREPEPRPNFPSGHISGTQPLPFTELLVESNALPESPEATKKKIEQVYKNLDDTFDPTKPTIVMCGTGVSACIVKTALEYAGITDVKLYDGSWTEWVLRSPPDLLANNRD